MNEQPMNDLRAPWQTPRVERLDVSRTLGFTFPNADAQNTSNTAFPNAS